MFAAQQSMSARATFLTRRRFCDGGNDGQTQRKTRVPTKSVRARGLMKVSAMAAANYDYDLIIIGAGVAGLQAIATAKRLGARVTAFDTRPVVAEQVHSLGAKFLEIDLSLHLFYPK